MDIRQNDIIEEIIVILKQFLNPSSIILFGSRAKKNNSSHSDFDFAVDCPKPAINIERQINESIERISGLYKVDIVYLGSIDEDFKDIILKTGRIVYERRT